MRMSLRFTMLGAVECTRDGLAVALGGSKQRTVMSMLLLANGRSVSVDQLVESVWGTDPANGAVATLRVFVSNLRRAVCPEDTNGIRFDGHAELGARMAREVCERLRYSNAETDRVEALVAHHMRFMDVRRMRESTLKKFMRLDGFGEYLELHRIDCMASNGRFDNYDFVREKLAAEPPIAMRPARLMTGDDLRAMGYQPGPRFKRILEFVEDGQLEGRFESKEAAIEAVGAAFSIVGES